MHQTHYKLLDSSVFKSFFNDINSDSLIGKDLSTWNGDKIETKNLINSKGILFFKEKNIILNDWSTIFWSPKNSDSLIHTDNYDETMCRINFVVFGKGNMNWYEIVDPLKEKVIRHFPDNLQDYYIKYNSYKSKRIIDVWESAENQIAVINAHKPHNIKTTDSTRLVLSIRLQNSFEQVCSLID